MENGAGAPALDVLDHNQAYYEDVITHYQKPTIRVVVLEPGNFRDPIVCRLRPLTLHGDGAEYRALSYAWMARSWRDITVNGNSGFKVTENLYTALRYLRDPAEAKTLWIDAISINQCNTEERNAQVAVMGEIYSSAELVYVWLGTCGVPEDTLEASRRCFIHHSNRYGQLVFDPGSLHLPAKSNLPAILQRDCYLNKLHYWWRTWAVQEVVLAQAVTVLIGPHEMPWRVALSSITSFCERSPFDTSAEGACYHQLEALTDIKKSRELGGDQSLRALLQSTVHRVAGDRRDKIYGLFSLVQGPQEYMRYIQPNYTKSLRQVNIDATYYLIATEQTLMALTYGRHRFPGGPSWTLDVTGEKFWHIDRDKSNFYPVLATPESVRFVHLRPEPVAQLRGERLIVAGIQLGSVSIVTRCTHSFVIDVPNDMSARLRSEDPATFNQIQELGASTIDLATLNNNARDQQKLTSTSNSALHLLQREIDRYSEIALRSWSIIPDSASVQEKYGSLAKFRSCAWDLLEEWPFFSMSGGFCGVAACDIAPNDVVAMLFGADKPFILRPTNVPNKYELICDCSVSGVDYEELLQAYQQGNVSATEFAIV